MMVVSTDGELTAWGPFKDRQDAEAFVASDKHLRSWAVLIQEQDLPGHYSIYPPERYWGEWPYDSHN